MASSALASPAPPMDRLDAARVLLGVVTSSDEEETDPPPVVVEDAPQITRRPRSGSAGLDALAELAMTMESPSTLPHEADSNCPKKEKEEDDCDSMPPPPPRRARSVSNPEGMEKWGGSSNSSSTRRELVLPSCILEEELAEANAAAARAEEEEEEGPCKASALGSSPDCVASPILHHDEEAETELDPKELLRRARARLFEDLSEGNIAGDKGIIVLPHALPKYNEVYNKNGRVGIYTPRERAAIIARFQDKRTRRVWNKKIRYNCRKSLADRRMRVKGRFVKRSTEVEAKAAAAAASEDSSGSASPVPDDEDDKDKEMPDVDDPEAGFSPTEDQPYRRLRRHTII